MSHQWLAAENFERSHELISAINTIVIHTQLSSSGQFDDAERLSDVEAARARLLPFLEQFSEIVKEAEHDEDVLILGADPRLASLAHEFLQARRQNLSSALHDSAIERTVQWLQSPAPATTPRRTREQSIEFLRALRNLLESNSHADVVGLLGVL